MSGISGVVKPRSTPNANSFIATAKVIRTFLIVETLDFLALCLLPSALCLLL